MKKTIAFLLSALLLLGAAGCSGGKISEAEPEPADPNLGRYDLAAAEMSGLQLPVESLYDGAFTIVLQEEGKADMTIDGSTASGTWTLDGTALNVNGGGLDLTGTLENGVMIFQNVDDSGITLTFYQEGYSSAANAYQVADPADTGEAYLSFENRMGAPVDNFYISDPESDQWGAGLYAEKVGDGETVNIAISSIVPDLGSAVDVCCITEDYLYCEIYGVMLHEGDTIALSADGETGRCVITHADGSQSEYEGVAGVQEN